MLFFDPTRMLIVIREDIYDSACNGNGRDRMTIMHELCHFFLMTLYGVKFSRRFDKPKPYEDPEWQAKALAGEFMIPADKVREMTVDEIAEKCGVSNDAATLHYNLIKSDKASCG